MRRYAKEHGMSRNAVAREGLRLLVGLPVPSSVTDELRRRLNGEPSR